MRPLRAVVAGDGPALLLLPGFAVTPVAYRQVIDHCARSARVIAPWLSAGDPWDFEQLLARVWDTVDAERLESLHIVGHSFGGALAIGLAAGNPRRVDSVTLVDSLGLSPGARRMAMLGLRPGNVRMLSVPLAVEVARAAVSGPRHLAASAWWGYRCDLQRELAAIAAAGIPRRVLWAAHDDLLPVWYGERLAAALGVDLEVVRDGGRRVSHDWPMRRPELFAARLRESADQA